MAWAPVQGGNWLCRASVHLALAQPCSCLSVCLCLPGPFVRFLHLTVITLWLQCHVCSNPSLPDTV